MPDPLPDAEPLLDYRFRVPLEGAPPPGLKLAGFLFDPAGDLLEGAEVRNGELRLTATASEARCGVLAIAPWRGGGEVPSRGDLGVDAAYFPGTLIEAGRQDYLLPPVPERLWRHWQGESAGPPEPESDPDGDFVFF